jgi:hypothetical protein
LIAISHPLYDHDKGAACALDDHNTDEQDAGAVSKRHNSSLAVRSKKLMPSVIARRERFIFPKKTHIHGDVVVESVVLVGRDKQQPGALKTLDRWANDHGLAFASSPWRAGGDSTEYWLRERGDRPKAMY